MGWRASKLDKAVIYYIRYLIEEFYAYKYDKEIEQSPFENTGEKLTIEGDYFKIEIHAHDWENGEDGKFKFSYKKEGVIYEAVWYKHCFRGLEIMSSWDSEEVLEMITECLEDWSGYGEI